SIFGNCGTFASFRVSGEDARALVDEFAVWEPTAPASEDYYSNQLQNLRDYRFYLRTLIDGEPREPFLVTSFPRLPNIGGESKAHIVRRTSLERFGRRREVVEEKFLRDFTS